MGTGFIIYARMDSRRLPGKVLMPLHGRPLLRIIVDKLRYIQGEHPIIIATSDRPVDDPIIQFAQSHDIKFFRGSLNVMDRTIACCEAYDLDYFIRICADRPFLPLELIDKALQLHAQKNYDTITNAFPQTYPKGTMTEIVNYHILKRISGLPDITDEDKEDLTAFFYKYPQKFTLGRFFCPYQEWKHINLSIDTIADKMRCEWIMSRLIQENHLLDNADLKTVVQYANEWAEKMMAGNIPPMASNP